MFGLSTEVAAQLNILPKPATRDVLVFSHYIEVLCTFLATVYSCNCMQCFYAFMIIFIRVVIHEIIVMHLMCLIPEDDRY